MLNLSEVRRYFLYREKADMRKSYDGLCGLVREKLKREPFSGEVFVFVSKRRNQLRLLQWEGDGFALYSKRLEKGTFEMPSANGQCIELSSEQLLFILKGIKLQSIERTKRFSFEKRSQ